MDLDSVLRESTANVLAGDATVQGVAVLDPSGLLIIKQARGGHNGIGNEEVLGSLAATSLAVSPSREPGVVTIETEQRNIVMRRDQGHTVIVTYDAPKEES